MTAEIIHIADLTSTVPHRIVSMIEHKGRVFVATERQVFELMDGIFHSMVFAAPQKDTGGEA